MKMTRQFGVAAMLVLVAAWSGAQEELRTPEGVRILQNKTFDDSDGAREKILEAFRDLRVTDVCDGMDAIGLQDIGLMDASIRPLWRDNDDFKHRIVGFAITVRHVPTDMRVGQNSFPDLDAYKKWKSEQYGRAPDAAWKATAKPGDIAVIDANGVGDIGFIGSNNSLGYLQAGVIGVVTNGNARDTDEIIKTAKIPVYFKKFGRGIRPGRLITESYNFPINCGGVLVFPGDVIVADGDGVIVVPRKRALEVAAVAREINEGDQKSRAAKYQDLDIPIDQSVEQYIKEEK